MVTVQDACFSVITSLHQLGTEIVGIREAVGRVLALDLSARITNPQVAVSAMDGYAIRTADVICVPIALKVVARSVAGRLTKKEVGPGEAIRIFTGAAVPTGADAILPQEDTAIGPEGTIIVHTNTICSSYIRPAGLDFKSGDVLLRAGRRLTFRDIALAAAMNILWIPVVRHPRVAIFSTGNEIRLPGEAAELGDTIGSTGFALSAFITSHGGVAIDLGIAYDEQAALLALANAARGSDLLLINGGMSVGEYDLVRTVLIEAGMILNFWQVAVRPGRPLMSGSLAGVPVIGLPGNPVSAMVSAVLFVLPALNTLLGLPVELGAERRTGVLACDLLGNDSRESYLRATWVIAADNTIHVTPCAQQDSAMQTVLAISDCLAIRSPHAPPAKMGDAIKVIAL